MMWMYIFVLALPFAAFPFPCTDDELELTQSTATTIYMVHSIDDVLNGSISQRTLLEKHSISDNDRQLPALLNTKAFRLANTEVHPENHPKMCDEKNDKFVRLFILSPKGSEMAGILYGCNMNTRINTMIFFYDEPRWNDEDLRYHHNYSRMSSNFQAEICGCNETVDKFIRSCVIAAADKTHFEQRMVFLGLFVFVIFVFLSSHVLKQLWK